MSNSSLVTYTKISPNHSNGRNGEKICRITIHHCAGNLSVETIGAIFAPTSRQASSNYGVSGSKVGLYVNEADRAWTSSNGDNDRKAVTIEVANSAEGVKNKTWEVTDESLSTTINLCADIMRRNGLTKAVYIEDKTKALAYKLKDGECLFTRHNFFAATACPGPYLQNKLPYIVDEVNNILSGEKPSAKTLYRCQVGAYKVEANAKKQLDKLKKDGYSDAFISKSSDFMRVQVGAFAIKSNADKCLAELKKKGYKDAFIKVVQV